jgi:CheY-like chemotaxis protein
VKYLVSLHGGSVEARSAGHGQGSEFIVRLPSIVSGEQPNEPAPDNAPINLGKRIVLVDDNVDAAQSMALLLQLEGFHVRIAHAGAIALQLIENEMPDFVLLDIGLPVMDGYQVANLIRERFGARGVQLVAITGYGQTCDRERALESGFDAHLTKPVALTQLLEILQREVVT